ncbi:MAG: alpha/beta hydrolase [Spirulinaceae cyanobacterium SM2_1_0]|nr:alpha/beta hydrolase [Spirulinaceae cyanobacterium SM2_1_0]
MRLHVEVRGRGFPLLCLHGHPGSAAALRVFTDYLATRAQTLAPDLRGYGRSRCRQPFAMTAHLDDLQELLARYQIQRCLVLGWSLGGILAMELALRQPQLVSGLVLIGTAARPRSAHPPVTAGDLVCTGIAALLNQLRPGWQWNIDTFGQRSLFRHLFGQPTPTAYRYLARDGVAAYLQTSRQAQQALNSALRAGYNRLPDLTLLHCPSLMLVGDRDCHITSAASEETAAQLPNCECHIYANTAHLLPWEQPQKLLADLEHWLRSHPTATDGHWLTTMPHPSGPGM